MNQPLELTLEMAQDYKTLKKELTAKKLNVQNELLHMYANEQVGQALGSLNFYSFAELVVVDDYKLVLTNEQKVRQYYAELKKSVKINPRNSMNRMKILATEEVLRMLELEDILTEGGEGVGQGQTDGIS
ncbi:hypothetical protein [Geomicrobium sp. JCM 19038]|uniref:hypothetical protein n=1 Tax=Geomicrobium sp. JCM 19038 TaxID=1460635 RepID=UPI00045F1CAC|nr:hypothetical protein [Geomicrobium sp. JCM 19038]GAK08966.1 hypothetical protein JCM19038_2770 [Geomicrobium sp. JCM 19038]